jgi:hypothetical protein
MLELMSFRPGHGPVQIGFDPEAVAERLGQPAAATRARSPAVVLAERSGLAAAAAASWRETGVFDPDRIAEIAGDSLERRADPARDPFDPRVGKWAAVVLRDDAAAARQALAPLVELRAAEGIAFDADGPSPGLIVIDRPAADKPSLWEEALREAAGAPPHHLLLVGGPDRFPFEIVSWWSTRRIVGVLDVADDPLGPLSWDAVHRYARKLRDRAAAPARRALVYAFRTDAATRRSHDQLALPLLSYLTEQTRRLPGAQAPVALLGGAATTRTLLDTAGSERPALIVTCTHGVEFPPDPRRWGALTSVDHAEPHGDPLSVDALAEQAFADGGVVFAFACFSAGIPGKSAVIELMSPGHDEPAQTPRIAPLPRFALGQDRGPVAFIGHVDRATSGSYGGLEANRAFEDLADFVLGGLGTVGQGMSTFWEIAGRAAHDLVAALRPDAASSSQQKVAAWVRNLDATGWLLLGDPCVRLFPGPEAARAG